MAGVEFSENSANETTFNVSAKLDDPSFGIIQSPFMMKKAKTMTFQRDLKVSDNKLYYKQETTVDIYGKIFNHTDTNQLTKI